MTSHGSNNTSGVPTRVSRRRVSRRRARFHDALVQRDRRRVTFSTRTRTFPRRGTERVDAGTIIIFEPH